MRIYASKLKCVLLLEGAWFSQALIYSVIVTGFPCLIPLVSHPSIALDCPFQEFWFLTYSLTKKYFQSILSRHLEFRVAQPWKAVLLQLNRDDCVVWTTSPKPR